MTSISLEEPFVPRPNRQGMLPWTSTGQTMFPQLSEPQDFRPNHAIHKYDTSSELQSPLTHPTFQVPWPCTNTVENTFPSYEPPGTPLSSWTGSQDPMDYTWPVNWNCPFHMEALNPGHIVHNTGTHQLSASDQVTGTYQFFRGHEVIEIHQLSCGCQVTGTYPLSSNDEIIGTYPLPSNNQVTETYPLPGNNRIVETHQLSSDHQNTGTYPLSGNNQVTGTHQLYSNNQVTGTHQLSSDSQITGTYPLSSNNQVTGTRQLSSDNQITGTYPLSSNKQVIGTYPLSSNKQVVKTGPLSSNKQDIKTRPLSSNNQVTGKYPLSNNNQVIKPDQVSSDNQITGTYQLSCSGQITKTHQLTRDGHVTGTRQLSRSNQVTAMDQRTEIVQTTKRAGITNDQRQKDDQSQACSPNSDSSSKDEKFADYFELVNQERDIRRLYYRAELTSYSDLIHQALLSSPSKSMVVEEIYQWFVENTDMHRNRRIAEESHIQWALDTKKVLQVFASLLDNVN